MTALEADARGEHAAGTKKLLADVQEIRELAEGYAFHFDGMERVLNLVTAFVARERLCCPFFRFRIDVDPQAGGIRLSLMGADGVKAFIRAELGQAFSDSQAPS